MDIKDIYKEKEVLEATIRKALEDFQGRTGLCPEWVRIDLIETRQIGSKRTSYILGQVYVGVKF